MGVKLITPYFSSIHSCSLLSSGLLPHGYSSHTKSLVSAFKTQRNRWAPLLYTMFWEALHDKAGRCWTFSCHISVFFKNIAAMFIQYPKVVVLHILHPCVTYYIIMRGWRVNPVYISHYTIDVLLCAILYHKLWFYQCFQLNFSSVKDTQEDSPCLCSIFRV